MPSTKQKTGSCGTLYDPPSPGPWKISARLTTYKAFQLIFGVVDEKAVREYVKRRVKGRGDWCAGGKRSKDWKQEIIMLGDELAAKYWPDLQEKNYLYYSLEQYITLIRQHANKYSKQKMLPTNPKGNDSDDKVESRDEEETAEPHDTLESDMSVNSFLTPTFPTPDHNHNETFMIPATLTPDATGVVRPTARNYDAFVRELAVCVEGRLRVRIDSLVQRESGRMEGQIRDVRRDVDILMEDVQGLEDWAIAMGDRSIEDDTYS